MQPFSDATVATIVNSADLVAGAANEIARSIYDQLKRRSCQGDEVGEGKSSTETQCVSDIAAFIRDIGGNIDAPHAQRLFSKRLGSFRMHHSGYAIVGDFLKPVLKDVLGQHATDRLCAAWGDVYWGIAGPISQAA